MKVIRFSNNWNGKLDNKIFSTIRATNPAYSKLRAGDTVTISYDNQDRQAIVISIVRHKNKSELSDWLLSLDTGYRPATARKIINSLIPTPGAIVIILQPIKQGQLF